MKVLRRSWRLAWLAGCTALMAGMAGVAAGPAQAQATGVIFQSHVVASWGDNVSGELGDGTHVSRSLDRDINAGYQVVQVSSGVYHSLAVLSDGTVWAWGLNNNGQLGRGGTSDHEATPARVLVLNRITRIAGRRQLRLGAALRWHRVRLGRQRLGRAR